MENTHTGAHVDKWGERRTLPEGLQRCPSLWPECCQWFPEWLRRWPERWQPRSVCRLHSGSLAAGGSYTGKNSNTNTYTFSEQNKHALWGLLWAGALISNLIRTTNSSDVSGSVIMWLYDTIETKEKLVCHKHKLLKLSLGWKLFPFIHIYLTYFNVKSSVSLQIIPSYFIG